MAILVKKREKLTVANTPIEWVDYKDGVSFEIYGISHPLYMQAQIKLDQRNDKEDLLNLNEKNGIEQGALIIGQYLVNDWTGIVDENNEPLEVTAENFVDLVVAEEGLLVWILEKSVQVQKNHQDKIDETKKKPSKGGSTKG